MKHNNTILIKRISYNHFGRGMRQLFLLVYWERINSQNDIQVWVIYLEFLIPNYILSTNFSGIVLPTAGLLSIGQDSQLQLFTTLLSRETCKPR